MNKGKLLYEGKAKRLYATDDPDLLWLEYKDEATAFDGEKKEPLPGKGALNNAISSHFFALLTAHGVAHHFVKKLDGQSQLVRPVNILPLEVVVRAVAAGSICRRLGLREGWELPRPIVEWYYKDDALKDPLVTEEHIRLLQAAEPEQLQHMRREALRIYDILHPFLQRLGVLLVDFKLEFGINAKGQLIVADEVSPDTCRFWDVGSGQKMDKDRFRQGLGGTLDGYREIWKRLQQTAEGGAECTR